MTEKDVPRWDCSQLSAKALSDRLLGLEDDASVTLLGGNVPNRHALAAGLSHSVSLRIEGSAGHFLFFLGQEANLQVTGDVGECCGHSMQSGSVLVNGHAAECLGAFARGGFIAVLGQAGDRCGFRLAGADLFVRSAVGDSPGYQMTSGDLVLGNGSGEALGREMTGGVIYVRGEVRSIAPHVRQVRMKDTDAMRLSLLLARAGIKGTPADFRAFKAKGTDK